MNPPLDLPPLRVLVVDDDEYNRMIVCRYLPSPPLDVATAVNGRAALDAAIADPPDVILLDLEMPVMDGFEAAAALREHERATGAKRSTIVGFSAHQDDAIRQRAFAAGCDRYVTKPLTRAVLLATLREAVAAAAPLSTHGNEPTGSRDDVATLSADVPVVVDPDLRSTLGDFLSSRGKALDEVDAALRTDERGQLRRLTHRLAGSFGLYGFQWAASHCRRLERDAERAERAQLADMLAALRRHLATVEIRCDDRAAGTKGGPVDGGTRSAAGGG